MSDEESFVILGSSPTSSLGNDGMEARKSLYSSLAPETPGSQFSSLRNSQISDLKNAQRTSTPKQNSFETEPNGTGLITPTKLLNTSTPSNEILNESKEQKNSEIAASKLWSRSIQVQDEENIKQLSLVDCALKSQLEQKAQKNLNSTSGEVSIKTAASTAMDTNLAASFIMGEINLDKLKTSVYSQFPSISLEACAEDVDKLQNMVTEYSQLKSTIKKANNTMKVFYQNSLQWKEKLQTMEEEYKQQLNDCKKEIAELRKQNDHMEKIFKTQMEVLEIVHKKDREEYVREMSEKRALLENMRAQIIKLEQQQLDSFHVVLTQPEQQQVDQVCVNHTQYNHKIKDLERQLSVLLASNLDMKDVEKQYVDELNFLKVNLTAASELLAQHRSEICQLKSLTAEQDRQIQTLQTSLASLSLAFEEQKERIAMLEAQNELHCADFEIEKQYRETAVKEKQQVLQDLRSLQKRNQELIEEQQKLTDSYQRRISSNAVSTGSKINQRPIRVLPSPSTPTVPALHVCPICTKAFKSLNTLLGHVDDCVDKN